MAVILGFTEGKYFARERSFLRYSLEVGETADPAEDCSGGK